jgi:DNA-directed RNA polymerase subunit M/transcription elongation factor TFIIS
VGRLIYDCRICGYFEKAKIGDEVDNCVYKSEHQKLSDRFYVDKECIKDPTLSRRKNVLCSKCGHTEAVTYTNPTKDRMTLIYVCAACAHSWRKDELD